MLLIRTADHGVILALGADDPHFVQGWLAAFGVHELGFPSLDAAPPLQTRIHTRTASSYLQGEILQL